jgi:predicted 3-demethylubiquinone-9 3-methyltransferase (glyoxalase superfamily)
MNHKIYPCIWFNDNGNEAAKFYCNAFCNAKIESENNIVTSFTINDQQFMALTGGPMFAPNPSISFFALFDTAAALDKAWSTLSEGAKVMMELTEYPWSEKYGWLQDKYGVSWQLMMQIPGSSMQNFIPALLFTQKVAGKAEAAMKFYTTVFNNAAVKDILRYEKDEHNVEGTVKHGRFVINNQLFIAVDSSKSHAFTFSEGVSLVVPCDTQEEIDYYWDALTKDGGQESMCGWLKDKFGVSWQIVPAILGNLMNDTAKAQKAAGAFMQMKKLNIAAILAACE